MGARRGHLSIRGRAKPKLQPGNIGFRVWGLALSSLILSWETYHLGLPIVRIIVFWGLYWGPPILGNYHIVSTDSMLT